MYPFKMIVCDEPTAIRAQSLDPRGFREHPKDFDDDPQAPVLCNKYAIDNMDNNSKVLNFRCQSMPRNYNKYKNQSAADIHPPESINTQEMQYLSHNSRHSQQLPEIPHSQNQLYRQDEDFDLQNNIKKNKRRERQGRLCLRILSSMISMIAIFSASSPTITANNVPNGLCGASSGSLVHRR